MSFRISRMMREFPSLKSERRNSCVSARSAPFDHPHVFLDMGDDREIICPYCSTLYPACAGSRRRRFAASRMRVEGQGRLTSAPASRTIVVAGAGIGGLTAAIALAEQRFHVIVLEKAAQLDEAGAGIQLSPNASGVLIRLGLEKQLIERVVAPDDITHRRRAQRPADRPHPARRVRADALWRALLDRPSRRPAGRAARTRARKSRHRSASRRRRSRTSPFMPKA